MPFQHFLFANAKLLGQRCQAVFGQCYTFYIKVGFSSDLLMLQKIHDVSPVITLSKTFCSKRSNHDIKCSFSSTDKILSTNFAHIPHLIYLNLNPLLSHEHCPTVTNFGTRVWSGRMSLFVCLVILCLVPLKKHKF